MILEHLEDKDLLGEEQVRSLLRFYFVFSKGYKELGFDNTEINKEADILIGRLRKIGFSAKKINALAMRSAYQVYQD